jgi:Tfp pilus assembly protein PilF
VILENLRLLGRLYYRPRAALAGIVDEGSLVFGALAVVLVSGLLHVPVLAAVTPALVGHPPLARAPHPAMVDDDAGGEEDASPPGMGQVVALFLASGSPLGLFTPLVALTVLYVPATLLLVTAFAPAGSFEVVLGRDGGPLLACAYMVFTAAFLPATLALVALGPGLPGAVVLGGGVIAFAALMVLAVQTVCGVRAAPAAGAIALSWIALGCQGLLVMIASPLILLYAWFYLRGDVGGILGAFSQRQGFKRYLHAATLNPRDADAHYQLGLLHLQRHQEAEAEERFKKAVEIDPQGEIDARFQLARLARGKERWEEALAHLERVLERDPRHARHEAWREAGAVYVATEHFEHARTVLARFVENRPYDPEGLYLLGTALARLGDVPGAADAFTRCAEAAGTAPEYRRRELRSFRQRAEQALAELRRKG